MLDLTRKHISAMNHKFKSMPLPVLFVLLLSIFTLNLSAADKFTLMVIPDSQIMTQDAPSIYTNEITWIKNNVSNLNIKFVSHVGDVVNVSNNTQYTNAKNAMNQMNGVVPYAIAAGNHDMGSDNFAKFNSYFPTSMFSGNSWWGGSYDSKNLATYQKFSAYGVDFIILHFAYNPSSAMLTWADGILKNNPNRKAIISTHNYLNTDGSRSSTGNTIWNSIVKNNANVFMVVCGHNHDANRRVDNNNFGKPVHQLLADYQGDNPQHGTVRYYTFDFTSKKINAYTYSTSTNHYRTESKNQFSLDIPFSITTGNTYGLTVTNGTGSNNYAAGTTVNITANAAPSGKAFDKWTINSGNPTIANVSNATTTLTMPANAAQITATYKDVTITTTNSLSSGQQLNLNQYIESSNKNYRFYLQGDGNLVFRNMQTSVAIWSSATNGKNGVRLNMQSDGNLVLYTAANKAVWASGTTASGITPKLVINDNGTLQLYHNSTVKWQQGTSTNPTTYALIVNSGNGDGNYSSGAAVTITADAAPSGKTFDKWVINSGNPTIANVSAATTTLTMSSIAASVTATYKTVPVGGVVQSAQGSFSWNGVSVDYKSQGGISAGNGGGVVATPAKNGDFEIVSFGASHGGGTGNNGTYFDKTKMENQKFKAICIRGCDDRKAEVWIRKNSGQTTIDIPAMAKVHNFIALDGNDVQIDLNSITSATGFPSGSSYTAPQLSGSGLKLVAFFGDDPTELLNVGSGYLVYQEWGFGDGDSFSNTLYAPGVSLPSSFPIKNHGQGGQQYVGVVVNFNKLAKYAGVNDELVQNITNLAQNYPNPFNPTTTISFALPNNSSVELSVMNSKGETVKVLASGNYQAGNHSFDFDGENLNSGIYFYQLSTPEKTITKKMMLIK